MLWDTFSNRWHFSGVLVARTALHVGAGSDTYDPVGTDLPVVRDERGNPYIPGSSLKGVIRARLEQLVRAFEPGGPTGPSESWNGKGACDPLDDRRRCVSKDRFREIKEEAARAGDPQERWPVRVYENSCRICRLFGSPWIAGKFNIADLRVVSESVVSSEIRDGVSIDRDKGTVKEKYDFEVVTPGSKFVFHAVAENLDEGGDRYEPGLILLGLHELRAGMIRLGGFKSRGLGVVELRDLKVSRVYPPTDADKAKTYLDYIMGKETNLLGEAEIQALIEESLSRLAEGR